MSRFPIPAGVKVFVALWIVALCVPTTRELGDSLELLRLSSEDTWDDGQSQVARWARENPDDATGAAWKAEIAFRAGERGAFDAVLARFPQNLEVRAAAIRSGCEGLNQLETARQRPDKANAARFVERAQMARAGGKLEPKNVFWPWMEAAFWFAARRDVEAIAAFERARKCSIFNDYAIQTNTARVDFWQRHDTVSFEKKLSLWASVLFPHLTPMSGAAKLVSERALDFRKKGDLARALSLQNAVLVAAQLGRRDTQFLIGALVCEGAAREGLEKFLAIPKPKTSPQLALGSKLWVDPTIHGRVLAQGWADYARQNGRLDLAKNADFVAQPSASREFGDYWARDDWMQFGLPAPWGTVAIGGPIFLAIFALAIAGFALVWVLGSRLKFEGEVPTRGQVVGCAHFAFWLLLGVLALGVAWLGVSNPFWSDESSMALTVMSLMIPALLALCWLLPVGFLNWKRGRKFGWERPQNSRALPTSWNRARKIGWLILALGLVWFALDFGGLWLAVLEEIPWALGVAIALPLAVLTLEIVRWQGAGWRLRTEKVASNAPVLSKKTRQIGFILWALASASLVLWFCLNLWDALAPNKTLVGLFAGAFLVGALVWSWKWGGARRSFFWPLAQQSAGVLALVWTFVLVALSLGLWPLRAQLNRNMDRQIRIGEVAWMREQIAKSSSD